ncbi:hypothetical protein AUEXF2481DRAFT_336545 [Aureobasidium subglaciale EXF-2481]|uniref:Uncharacterized protein n=1 Tax=Aureobasidium subglaciale (strain EXF-2481) TaxID=1043005 RepID=A0A074YGT8_AURSE|nr:uncharacterized protein AUEXF2481DRAFT_336545 [Aureobasidium subglaciale EXF-2481]KEQ93307.1 hypothetical protein AUEXF2481DRAFT_336545 [Aureobasidium subglaciale EXF-2481]
MPLETHKTQSDDPQIWQKSTRRILDLSQVFLGRREVRMTRNPSAPCNIKGPHDEAVTTTAMPNPISTWVCCGTGTSRASMPRVVVSLPRLPGCLECLDELCERSEIR